MKHLEQNSYTEVQRRVPLIAISIIMGLSVLLLIFSIFTIANRSSMLEKNFRWVQGWTISEEEERSGKSVTIFSSQVSNQAENQVLYCQGRFQFATVWINNKIAGVYPGNETDPKSLGLWSAMIPLPKGDLNIVFRVSSPYQNYQGKMLKIYLSSEENIRNFLSSQSLLKVSVATVGIMLGIFFIIVSIAGYPSHRIDFAMIAFGIFTIIYSLFTLFHEGGPDYLIYTLLSPRVVGNVSLALFYLMLIPNFSIFFMKSTTFRKVNAIIFSLVVLFVSVACLSQPLGFSSLPQFLPYRQWLTLGLSAFYSVTTLIEYRRGNRFAIWLFTWISITMAAYVIDIYGLLQYLGLPNIRVSYIFIYLMFTAVFTKSISNYINQVIQDQRERQNILMKNQMTLERFENSKEYLEQMEQIRHEIKNHHAALRIILDQGDLGKAQRYLSEIDAEDQVDQPFQYTQNFLVDGILHSAATRIRKNGIRFTCDIELPEELPFSENKLSSFLMNLLDNAIDSCQRKPEQEDRFIHLSMKVREPYLLIKCANTKGNELILEEGQYVTSKEDARHHGYGLKIMKRIAANSDGSIEIKDGKNVFTLLAMLKLKE